MYSSLTAAIHWHHTVGRTGDGARVWRLRGEIVANVERRSGKATHYPNISNDKLSNNW